MARLGWPLAVANFGQVAISAVDLAVVGRLGPVELGAAGLGHAVFFAGALAGMGLMLGFDPLLSQAYGASEHLTVRRLLWQGLWLVGLLSAPLMMSLHLLGQTLEWAGVGVRAAEETRRYLVPRLWGLPPFLIFVALRSTLQACGVTRPVLYGVIVANLANLPLSIVLVFGSGVVLGVPELVPPLGVRGAAWASTVATLVQVGVMAPAVRALSLPRAAHHRRLSQALLGKALRLGVPISLSFVGEFGAFVLVNVLIGRIGEVPLAAHQVAMTLASATYVVPLGIGAAASVRVGQAIGRHDATGARVAAVASVVLGGLFMSAMGLAFWISPRTFAGFITDDPLVLGVAAQLIVIAAVFQLCDGIQAVLSGALRGAGRTRSPLVANLVGHYAIGLPTGITLAFAFHLGSRGLWWGLSAGLTAVAMALAIHWRRVSAGPLLRV